ncbi:butyrophilin subfamily 2 member A2-like [Thunnus maccoyii]|uniref:butyrophilin subfamily 2 member A2-like n=1 Tax=Thunnus maccoyii TaxID=8240 RepID=UPI001C4D8311|nr:butyrophilin subfamily 2 member A2-like [Thunnus maccoyii]
MTMVGDDVVLPCQLKPPTDAVPMILEWERPDLNPRFVFMRYNGQEFLVDQNEAYNGRTSLSIDKLKHGDISLKISKVKISDEGTYRCYIPKLNKEYFVELVVGAVSSPGISLVGIDRSSSGVILQCESKRWYPEPEMFWLDGEGNLLSAGPTETVRGPDGLYTVSSRVTVEKRHNNNFTCRVQQNNINQTRETHIHVPEQRLLKEGEDTRVQLTESKKMVDLEKEKAKLNEELQKEAEEQKHLEQLINKLKEQKTEFLNQKGQITVKEERTMKLMEENETKFNLVEKEISEKEGDKTVNRAQGYLKLKEIIKAINWSLEERKQEEQTLEATIDKGVKMTDIEVLRMTNKNEQLQSHMEEINEQLEKINRQQDEIQEKLKSETKEKKEDNKTNLLTHNQVI